MQSACKALNSPGTTHRGGGGGGEGGSGALYGYGGSNGLGGLMDLINWVKSDPIESVSTTIIFPPERD